MFSKLFHIVKCHQFHGSSYIVTCLQNTVIEMLFWSAFDAIRKAMKSLNILNTLKPRDLTYSGQKEKLYVTRTPGFVAKKKGLVNSSSQIIGRITKKNFNYFNYT